MRAKRTQSRSRVGQANHRQWSRPVLAVERRRMRRIKSAGDCVLGVVEPEADTERARWCEAHRRIEAEDLVKQDGSDDDVHRAFPIGLEVRLVPSQTEVEKSRVRRPVRQQIAVLDSEEIELEPGLDVLSV